MQAFFGFFRGKNGVESFQGGIGKNRTFDIVNLKYQFTAPIGT